MSVTTTECTVRAVYTTVQLLPPPCISSYSSLPGIAAAAPEPNTPISRISSPTNLPEVLHPPDTISSTQTNRAPDTILCFRKYEIEIVQQVSSVTGSYSSVSSYHRVPNSQYYSGHFMLIDYRNRIKQLADKCHN